MIIILDLETTGLCTDPDADILEVAALALDEELEVVDEFSAPVVGYKESSLLKKCVPFVQEMHRRSR